MHAASASDHPEQVVCIGLLDQHIDDRERAVKRALPGPARDLAGGLGDWLENFGNQVPENGGRRIVYRPQIIGRSKGSWLTDPINSGALGGNRSKGELISSRVNTDAVTRHLTGPVTDSIIGTFISGDQIRRP